MLLRLSILNKIMTKYVYKTKEKISFNSTKCIKISSFFLNFRQMKIILFCFKKADHQPCLKNVLISPTPRPMDGFRIVDVLSCFAEFLESKTHVSHRHIWFGWDCGGLVTPNGVVCIRFSTAPIIFIPPYGMWCHIQVTSS